MVAGVLGKTYKNSEIIIKQGDLGDSMYVIQDGMVEIIRETPRGEVRLGLRGKGEFFGEMGILTHQVRSATARAMGEARVLSINKKDFLRRIHEDPSIVFRLVETLSANIRDLSAEVTQLKLIQGSQWSTEPGDLRTIVIYSSPRTNGQSDLPVAVT